MNRKKTSIILAFALTVGLLLATPTISHGASQPAVGDNIVRVHLNSYGAPASVSLNASGAYTIQNNGKAISGSFTAAASGSGIKITSGGASYSLGGDVYIKAGSLAVSNLIQINGSYRYAGDMRIVNKGGGLKLINHVDIETYVMGVLPYEVSNSWPIESLKAQAVAARSYAYFVVHSKIRTSVEHDLVNSTAHQVYYGYNASFANCINAVNATKNMIMKTKSGQIVYACFSASNGGTTETGIASGVAASNFDYLSVKDDPYDLKYALATTAYSGKMTIPKELTAAKLKDSSEQPYRMLRDKLKAAGVNTNSLGGDVKVKSIVLTNPKVTGPDRQFTGAKFVLGIPNGSDATVSFGPVSINGSSAKYPFLNSTLGLGTKFTMLALSDNGKSWTLASVRFGHGAGLSQVGAYQMAVEGKSYKDILKFYYDLGSKTNLVTMPWDNSGGTSSGALGYTVTAVARTGKVNTPGSTLNIRGGPGTGLEIVGSLKDGAKVTINGQVADWWRTDLGNGKNGFVSSAFITLDAEDKKPADTAKIVDSAPTTSSKTGKVNTPGTTLNVRSGAGTTFSIIGSLKHGDTISVTTENSAWYKVMVLGRVGYVSAAFIVLDNSAQPPATTQSKTVYVNTPGALLNVRSGPGTNHAILGTLKHGEKLSVTDENNEWYKLTFSGKTGYVSKTWTKADNPAPATPQTKTVYVNTQGNVLNVRSGPGMTHAVLGTLKHGEKLSVTDENSEWYKLAYNGKTGYVSKAWTKADNPAAAAKPPTSPTTPTSPTSKTVYANTPGTILNVRSGPGTSYSIIGGYKHGEKITVAEENSSWYRVVVVGRIGYINKSFVTESASGASGASGSSGSSGSSGASSSAQPATKTGTVNSTVGLNVRSGPGTDNKILGGIAHGTKVTILEQSDGWYKIKYGAADGWVNATYVTV